jgi:hypothetical protein
VLQFPELEIRKGNKVHEDDEPFCRQTNLLGSMFTTPLSFLRSRLEGTLNNSRCPRGIGTCGHCRARKRLKAQRSAAEKNIAAPPAAMREGRLCYWSRSAKRRPHASRFRYLAPRGPEIASASANLPFAAPPAVFVLAFYYDDLIGAG